MPEDVPSLQRSSSFHYPEERTVVMEISESISQLPSDDFTVVCVTTIIFFFMGILVLLISVLAWLAK